MAYSDSPYGEGETAEQVMARLAAMQRAMDAQREGERNTSPAPTNTGGSWSGSDAGAAYGGYDMDALRRQAAALGAQANAANAASTAQFSKAPGGGIASPAYVDPATSGYVDPHRGTLTGDTTSGGTTTGAGSTFNLDPLRKQADELAAAANAANAGSTTGQSDSSALQRAATGGTLGTTQPPTGLTGSLATTPTTTGLSVGDAFSKMTQGINDQVTGAGAGTADTSALARAAGAGTGAGAGPSGAGSSTIDQGGAGGLGALTSSITSQLQSIGQAALAPGNAPDVGQVYLQQAQSILKMLDEQEAQMRAENEKQGTTIDPSTQFTLDKIRESLDENIKTTKEDMNRRGILGSGIELELGAKLRKGSASDAAMVMASRLSKLQDQLSQGLSSIRSQKVSTLSSFGRDAAQANFTAGENAKRNAYDREQAALRGMLDLRGQQSTEANQAANRSFQGQESALNRSFQSNESALERAYGQAQSQAKTAAEFEANRIAYEREKALVDQRSQAGAYTSGGTGGGGSSQTKTVTKTGATGTEPNSQTWQAINGLMNTFGTTAEAVRAINEQQDELVAAGVDLSRLYDAAGQIKATDRRRS